MEMVAISIHEVADVFLELLRNYFLDIGAPNLASSPKICYRDGDAVTFEVCVAGCIYRLEVAEDSGVRDLDGLHEYAQQMKEAAKR